MPQIPPVTTAGLTEAGRMRRHREVTDLMLNFQHDDSRIRTPAEVAAGVTPVSYAYAPEDARRQGLSPKNSAADNAAAFQRALDATPDGGMLRIPCGRYAMQGEFTRSTAISLVGDGTHGIGGSVFEYTHAAGKFFTITGGGSSSGSYLSNFRVVDMAGTAACGIFVDDTYNSMHFDHVFVEGFTAEEVDEDEDENVLNASAWRLRSCWNIKMTACTGRQSYHGLHCMGGGVAQVVNELKIEQLNASACSEPIRIDSGAGITLDNVDLSDYVDVAIELGVNLPDSGQHQIKSILLLNCWGEGANNSTPSASQMFLRIGKNAARSSSWISDIVVVSGYTACGGDYIETDVAQDVMFIQPLIGARQSGKKTAIFGANSQRIRWATSPRSDITDNTADGVTYLSHDLIRAPFIEASNEMSGPRVHATTALQIASGADVEQLLTGTTNVDFGSVADGGVTTVSVTVTGAALGDVVLGVSHTLNLTAGAILHGQVTATNTVSVTLYNRTGGALDPASGTVRAVVARVS